MPTDTIANPALAQQLLDALDALSGLHPGFRVEGIDSSGDPLTEVRSDIYLLSGRRRRAAFGDGRR
jgi:hypothetical protein